MMDFKSVGEEAAYWNEKFKLCEQQRKAYEGQWYLNLAFYFSKQWVVLQRTASGVTRLYDPPTPRSRVRLTANRIKPVIRDELTKLIKEEPQFYAVPNTTEPSDVAEARVSESLCEFSLTNYRYNRIRRQATFWALITGTSFIKATCPGIDADLLYERLTAFHVFVEDLDEEDIQRQPYVMHCRGVSPQAIEEKYNVKVEPDMNVNGSALEQKFLNSLGVVNKDQKENKMVFVKEIWIKPCKKYPQGGLLIYAGKQLVYRYSPAGPIVSEDGEPIAEGEDAFPYEHGNFPINKMDHTATGRFYGESTIVDLIPLQKEYNKTRSQLIEAKNRMAKPQMTYVKGSVDVTKITSEPGLYIPVNPGFDAPRAVEIQSMPEYVSEEPQRIKEDMDEVAGRNEVSRGGVPPGIEAASAIAYLKEQNDSQVYNTVASIEDCTQQVGQQTLALISQFWSPQKIIDVVSKNSTYEAELFKNYTLKGNTDIRVEPGSMAPKSKAAQQAFITDLMEKGIIPPEKGLRYLQMSETNRLYDEMQVDSKQAQRENAYMAAGNQVMPNDWDNDQVHIYEHELFMKSQEFEGLDQQIQQVFINHLTATKQKVINYAGGAEQSGGPGPGNNSAIPTDQQQPGNVQPQPTG